MPEQIELPRCGSDAVHRLSRRRWIGGRGLSRGAALAFVQDRACAFPSAAVAAATTTLALTRRERETAALVARGLSTRQIADALVITQRTAEKHIDNIRVKLGVSSRAQIAVWWVAQAGQSMVGGRAHKGDDILCGGDGDDRHAQAECSRSASCAR